MSRPAIKVEGLSKSYRIGAARAPYKTIREAMTRAALSPMRWLRKNNSENQTVWALKDISFEVQPGEVIGVIGRNGAGKSTLLKILSRITYPTHGFAEIHGRIGSLLEVGTGFHPELTGRENIFLNGSILGMKKKEIAKKFDEIVDFAEVEKFIDTPVKRYSSGMYMRLAFAVAAHLEPEILLVDEVLAVGDAGFQKKCLGKMGEVARQGRTVLFVNHNMSAVLNLCERGILIDSGKVVFLGDSHSLVEKYLSINNQCGYGFSDLTRHPGREPGKRTQIKGIGLRQSSSTGYLESVKTGDDFDFEISYDCENEEIDLVQIGISSLTGQRIFTVGTHLCPGFDYTLKGKGILQCHLPNVLLAQGEYTVTVMFGKRLPPHNLDYIENALYFRVEFNDYFKTGLGPLPGQGNLVQRSVWTREDLK